MLKYIHNKEDSNVNFIHQNPALHRGWARGLYFRSLTELLAPPTPVRLSGKLISAYSEELQLIMLILIFLESQVVVIKRPKRQMTGYRMI